MEVRKTQTDTHVLFLRSFVTLVKHYGVSLEHGDKQTIILCQYCNKCGIFSGKSVGLLYITFLHTDMPTLGIYPKNTDP